MKVSVTQLKALVVSVLIHREQLPLLIKYTSSKILRVNVKYRIQRDSSNLPVPAAVRQYESYEAFYFPGACATFRMILSQCGILCLDLEAVLNGRCYAEHISCIRVAICLCTAINLRLDADCSHLALSYPSYCPPLLTLPVVIVPTDHHHRWLSARRGQQKGLS